VAEKINEFLSIELLNIIVHQNQIIEDLAFSQSSQNGTIKIGHWHIIKFPKPKESINHNVLKQPT